jgi:hypothetical protein
MVCCCSDQLSAVSFQPERKKKLPLLWLRGLLLQRSTVSGQPEGWRALLLWLTADSFLADRFSTDHFSTDRFSTDRFSTDRFSTDRFSTDRFSTDRFSVDSSFPRADRVVSATGDHYRGMSDRGDQRLRYGRLFAW